MVNHVGSPEALRGAGAVAAPPRVSGFRVLIRFLPAFLLLGGLLFGAAGRTEVWQFWAFFGVLAAFVAGTYLGVLRHDAELLAERARRGPGDADPWTRPLMLLLMLAALLTAGLEARYARSGGMAEWVKAAGLAGVAAGCIGWGRAMAANRFFSGQVRIQAERGHAVVESGPYSVVRHPGYAAALALFGAMPLALGSWWACLPAAGMLTVFLRRTALEDRFLRAQLPGYAAYAERVKYRLLPGVW
jgi:protein-S-isoprenylcysteine O-methyltransferase Ste14